MIGLGQIHFVLIRSQKGSHEDAPESMPYRDFHVFTTTRQVGLNGTDCYDVMLLCNPLFASDLFSKETGQTSRLSWLTGQTLILKEILDIGKTQNATRRPEHHAS